MVVVVEIVVHSDIELVSRIAGLNVLAIVVVVGARVARDVGSGKYASRFLATGSSMLAGILLFGNGVRLPLASIESGL